MKKQKFKNLAIFYCVLFFSLCLNRLGAHLQMRPSIEVFQAKVIK